MSINMKWSLIPTLVFWSFFHCGLPDAGFSPILNNPGNLRVCPSTPVCGLPSSSFPASLDICLEFTVLNREENFDGFNIYISSVGQADVEQIYNQNRDLPHFERSFTNLMKQNQNDSSVPALPTVSGNDIVSYYNCANPDDQINRISDFQEREIGDITEIENGEEVVTIPQREAFKMRFELFAMPSDLCGNAFSNEICQQVPPLIYFIGVTSYNFRDNSESALSNIIRVDRIEGDEVEEE